MTTFRDLAGAADRHLIAAASHGGALSQVDAARAAGELAMLSRICGRVLDDVLDCFPEPTTVPTADLATDPTAEYTAGATAGHAAEGTAWRAAANTALNHARAAERQLQQAAAAYGPKDDTAGYRVTGCSASLRSAIKKLGLAEEVLQTELTSGVPGSRQPIFPGTRGLSDPDTAREITALTGRWIGLIGEVCDRTAKHVRGTQTLRRVDVKPIPKLLQQAARHARNARHEITQVTGPATQLSERLAQLPRGHAHTEQRNTRTAGLVRAFLELAEDEASALRRALNTGEPRYGAPPGPTGPTAAKRPPVSARSLRYVAASASSVHTAAAIITRQLAARVAELTGSTHTPAYQALTSAADALTSTGRAWNTTARGWDPILTRDISLHRAAEHATGAVMRLGNAAYADPDWTPTSPNTTVRPATEFAADLDDVRAAAAHLERILTAYTGAAHASVRAIATLYGRNALYTELGDKPVPAQPADIGPLRSTYNAVLDHAVTARQWLHRAQTATVRAHAHPTAHLPAHAPALAATDFPNQPLTPAEPTARTTGTAPAPAATAAASASVSGAASVTEPAPAAVRPARRTR